MRVEKCTSSFGGGRTWSIRAMSSKWWLGKLPSKGWFGKLKEWVWKSPSKVTLHVSQVAQVERTVISINISWTALTGPQFLQFAAMIDSPFHGYSWCLNHQVWFEHSGNLIHRRPTFKILIVCQHLFQHTSRAKLACPCFCKSRMYSLFTHSGHVDAIHQGLPSQVAFRTLSPDIFRLREMYVIRSWVRPVPPGS